MKKIIGVLLVVAMLFAFAACAKTTTGDDFHIGTELCQFMLQVLQAVPFVVD